MKFNRSRLLIGLALALGAASTARAQTKDQPAKLGDAELQLMAKVHHANQMEIDMAKLAATQAKSAEVKSYAARLVKDHTKADGKIMDLAKKHDVTLPQATPKDDAEKKQMDEETANMTRLKGLEGEAFDRDFVSIMVNDHNRALKMLSDAQPQIKDPQLLSFIKSVRPALQQHLKMAEKLASKVGKSTSEKSPSSSTQSK